MPTLASRPLLVPNRPADAAVGSRAEVVARTLHALAQGAQGPVAPSEARPGSRAHVVRTTLSTLR